MKYLCKNLIVHSIYVGKEICPMLRQFNVLNYNIDEKNEKFQPEYATAKNQISWIGFNLGQIYFKELHTIQIIS